MYAIRSYYACCDPRLHRVARADEGGRELLVDHAGEVVVGRLDRDPAHGQGRRERRHEHEQNDLRREALDIIITGPCRNACPIIGCVSSTGVDVITSYSIHYTKLYEIAGKRQPILELFDTACDKAGGRITSYNVCYTKLLRAHDNFGCCGTTAKQTQYAPY